ncbi:MAG: FtsX-like permease family protein [Acidobacteria bacterium]|nr:MAG: FtsX-like permease family protein [Acidobacteriota bacterium]
MDWATGIREAFGEFAHHRLRTLLTLLGMIFGVGAVISMLSIGQGARRQALEMIDALGLRNVIVEAVEQPEERLKEIREDSLGLTLRDLEVALDTLPQVVAHTAIKEISVYGILSGEGRSDAAVFGVSPTHFDMAHVPLAAGRAFTEQENLRYAPVAVIGARVARDLFGSASAVGRLFKVNHVWLTVVGVAAPRAIAGDSFEGVALDAPENRIYVPIRTALKRFRFKPLEDELDAIHLQVDETASIPATAATVRRLLEVRHQGVRDYRIVVPQDLLEQHRRTQRIFDIVMASIAGISLLVGGIGIMNIMLATVVERTREIGIRRAVGARRGDIRRQFVIEALTVSLAGGLAGVVLGFALAWAISAFSGWPFAWSFAAPLVAFTVCAATGLVFGIYPAEKAARLDPIEALSRHM